MEAIKFLSLVKYDYDSLPISWKEINVNIYEGVIFVYFGEIPQMPGHSYVQELKTGKPRIFHTENCIALTDEEV